MKWTAALVFVGCLAFASAQITSEAPTEPSRATTDKPATTTSTVATTHPVTSEKPTEHPNTTTTTTPAPKPSSTTPKPQPAPKEATVNSYNVTDPATNNTCILVTAALQLKLSYLTKDNQTKEGVLPLDNETVVDHGRSSCSSPTGEQTLALTFDRNYNLSLVFAKNATVYLREVTVQFVVDTVHFPDSAHQNESWTVKNNTFELYSVPEERSYYCPVDEPVYLGSGVTLDVLNVQLQAFINSTVQKPGQFGSAMDCAAGDISNIVPIAVGSALAALVIIVLIAYLIGRSRSRQKGYQSV